MSVSISFKWYDIWIGIYIDRANKAIYICPIPCIVIKVRKDTDIE